MTVRPYNTAVYMLRCLELGLHPSDLEWFSYGDIMDLLIERGNDGEKWDYKATQEDMDRL